MDSELAALVEAVRDGRITDASRVREILVMADVAIAERYAAAGKDYELFEAAKKAFIDGWRGQSQPRASR